MTDGDLIGIIELGDVKIKCIIAKVNNENFSEILSTSSIESQGIHNGTVVNIAKASDAVRLCISEAEKRQMLQLKRLM